MKEQGTLFRERIKKVHVVGVGGIGMSGIAEILISLGYERDIWDGRFRSAAFTDATTFSITS